MLYVISTIAISPFIEELVMRGFIFSHLRKSFPVSPSVIVVLAITFYFHWQLVAGDHIAAIVLGFGGLVLCVIRDKTTSLWNCILFHSVHNAAVIHQWSLIVFVLGILFPFVRYAKNEQLECPPVSSKSPTP